jgi:hypothetical protein
MLVTKQELLAEIDYVIERLKGGSLFTSIGRTPEPAKTSMLDYFEKLRVRIENDSPIIADFSIIRGLDYWGITSGDLFDRSSRISSGISGLYEMPRRKPFNW